MSPIRAAVLTAALLLSWAAGRARAAAPPDWLALRSQEERAELLLSDALGPGRARVFLRARAQASAPAEGPDAALFDRVQRSLDEAPPVLPGFALPRTLKDEILRAYAAPAPGPTVLEATLVLDRGVPQEGVQRAMDLTERVLNLDAERGDSLRLVRENIAPQATASGRAWGGLSERALAGLQSLLATAVLLVAALAALRMIVPLPGGSRSRSARRTALRRRLAGSAALARLLPDPDGADLPRLKPGEAGAAAEFLSGEPSAAAAAALRVFGARTAALVLRRMSAPARRAAAAELARAREQPASAPPAPAGRRWPWTKSPPPPEPVGRRLARRLGEEEREAFLDELFLRLDRGEQDELAAAVETVSPARARSLRGLPDLDDLAAAEPAALRVLLCRFSSAELAGALHGAQEATRERLLASLPDAVAATVGEEEVAVDPGGERTLSLRGELLARWRRLSLEGRVPPAAAP
ncbi:MAG: hypothetical protein WC969_06345 [Elusimicrobiota bacterium]